MEAKQTPRVRLNVRGTKFEIENDILQKMPLSKLARLCLQLDSGEEMFFNRDPFVFNAILNYYVTGHLHVPSYMCPESIREEMAFWEMTYDDQMAPCCLDRLLKADGEMSKTVEWKKTEDSPWPNGSGRRKWHRFFEFPNSSWAALIWGTVIFAHIIMSIAALIMSYAPTFKHYDVVSEGGSSTLIEDAPLSGNTTVMVLEYLSLGVLAFDYVIRLGLAQNKIRFVVQALNIIDLLSLVLCLLLAVLSTVLCFVSTPRIELAHLVVGALSMIRVFRLLRLVRICRKMELILRVIWASVIELLVFGVIITVLTLIFGVSVYLAESVHAHSHFRGPLDGMWYAIVTLTTVGYGDSRPLSPFGKVLGSLCAMAGLLSLGLPVPAFAHNFGKYRSMLAATKRAEKHGKINQGPDC